MQDSAQQEQAVIRHGEVIPVERARFMPVLRIEDAIQRRKLIQEAIKELMEPGRDYGTIPGTDKPSLWKPGAEKLNTIFGLIPEMEELEGEADWTGERHNGEAFFFYKYRCRLLREGLVMGECIGLCSSFEVKYRYRSGDRECPACHQPAIIKGKAEYGGDWICYKKRGGCGANFGKDDERIGAQPVGKIKNPDVADQANTVLKMAQKRAYVGATVLALNASDFFDDSGDGGEGQPRRRQNQPTARGQQRAQQETRPPAQDSHPGPAESRQEIPKEVLAIWQNMTDVPSAIKEFLKLKMQIIQVMGPGGETEYYRVLAQSNVKHANEFKRIEDSRQCASRLWQVIQAAKQLRGAGEPQPVKDILDKADSEQG
jgi:hypothetical protein